MQEKYTNAFLAAGPEDKNFALELTYNYGKDSYNIGSGFGHFALRVEDVYKTVDSIKAAGVSDRPARHHTGSLPVLCCAAPLCLVPGAHMSVYKTLEGIQTVGELLTLAYCAISVS